MIKGEFRDMDRDDLIDHIITIIAMTVAVCLSVIIVGFITEYSISETEKTTKTFIAASVIALIAGRN